MIKLIEEETIAADSFEKAMDDFAAEKALICHPSYQPLTHPGIGGQVYYIGGSQK